MDKWDAFSLRERINKLFEVSHASKGMMDSPTWVPVVDIYETPEEFVVKAELPEVTESSLNITVEGNVLKISGERKFHCEGRSYYQVERTYGTFFEVILLPRMLDRDNYKSSA